jgi:predicted ATP-grasp superfamily ATP-dependent carboligase
MSEPEDHDLLIVGASTRAAAFSALRAGLRPRCADLFADADLRARCPVERIPPGGYPALFAELARRPSTVPWMYTGGMENRRRLVARLAERRPLWGNNRDVLARCRNPWFVASQLRGAGLPCPAVRSVRDGPPPSGRWLAKPLRGAGGTGITFAGATAPRRPSYLQEYIEGEPHAALFCARKGRVDFLGVTQQLVGERWLHAGAFHYCGSLFGPGFLRSETVFDLVRMGEVLAQGCGLRGLFGVDFLLRDDVPFPVEINPRYTASVELLHHAGFGAPALVWHACAFEDEGVINARFKVAWVPPPGEVPVRLLRSVGKAVLFARRGFTFPAEGPWQSCLDASRPAEVAPDFADIPEAGQRIEAGQPVLTLFARAPEMPSCLEALRRSADALDPLLFGR